MGYYTEYLDRRLDAQQMAGERKRQLKRISELRGGRDVLVYAADMDKPNTPPAWLAIAYSDLVPFHDQLSNLNGSKLDLILETGGGSGEVAEDIVRSLHDKYEEVAIDLQIMFWTAPCCTARVPTSPHPPLPLPLSASGEGKGAGE